jgi:hypothetical protein
MNVKPLLVPISERGVLGIAQVLLLHPISERQVHSIGNFGATLGPLLPQEEQISKEVQMGLDSPIRLTKVDKNRQGKSQSHNTNRDLGGMDGQEPQTLA